MVLVLGNDLRGNGGVISVQELLYVRVSPSRVFFYIVYDQQYSKRTLFYQPGSLSGDKAERMAQKAHNSLREKELLKLNHWECWAAYCCSIIYLMIKLDWSVHSFLLTEAEESSLERVVFPWKASVKSQEDGLSLTSISAWQCQAHEEANRPELQATETRTSRLCSQGWGYAIFTIKL